MSSAGDAVLLIPGFQGALYLPGSAAYAESKKIYNDGMYGFRQPLAIARVASLDDVAACVRFATASGVEFTVYGGGHSVQGFAIAEGALW